MFKRKIESVLTQWKSEPNHKPLVIKGCRQCGKTFSVRHFAEKNYQHVVYMDFHEHGEYKLFFTDDLSVETIITKIMMGMPQSDFVAGKTCLILDEIQDCPKARSSLKFFKQDGRFDVICTGSLLGVNGYKTKDEWLEDSEASIPVGYEQIENMYPMDFEEWLWANGVKEVHLDELRRCLREEVPVAEAYHTRMRDLFLKYVIVGGMPEAVKVFMATHNINKVRDTQLSILDTYKGDMVKYALVQDKPHIRECFDSIPRQLAKENKKFTYSVVRKGARGKDYIGSIQWIEDAGIIRRCYNTQITELPLDGNAIQDQYKVYMADTGLFVCMLEEGSAWDIMQGNLGAYKGAVYENVVADVLGKMGRRLYYFHKNDSIELDFLFRYKGECVPIECKARTGNAKSLSTVLKHPEKYHVSRAIKMGDYNIGREGPLLTIPMYLAFLLIER